jgi:hypothetical protein
MSIGVPIHEHDVAILEPHVQDRGQGGVLQHGDGVGAVRKEIAQGRADRLRGHHEIDVAPKTLVEGQRHRAAHIARYGWRNDSVAVKNDRAGHERHHTL